MMKVGGIQRQLSRGPTERDGVRRSGAKGYNITTACTRPRISLNVIRKTPCLMRSMRGG